MADRILLKGYSSAISNDNLMDIFIPDIPNEK